MEMLFIFEVPAVRHQKLVFAQVIAGCFCIQIVPATPETDSAATKKHLQEISDESASVWRECISKLQQTRESGL